MLKRVIGGIRMACLRWKFPAMFVESTGPAVVKLHVGEDPDAGCYYLGGDHIPGKLTGRELMDRMARRDWSNDVLDFDGLLGPGYARRHPGWPPIEVRDRLSRKVKEEFGELMDAVYNDEGLGQIAKEGMDTIYTVIRLLLAHGIDPNAAWAAVHHSNMTRSGPPGPDGKTKGPNYMPPDMVAVIRDQAPIERGRAA